MPAVTAWTGLPPYSLQWGAWATILAVSAAYGFAASRPSLGVRRRQALAFLGALVAAAAALTWPLADIATHRLLVALVVQRLVLVLAVPPLVIIAAPARVVAVLTRPAPVDALARTLSRPVPAIVVLTVVAVGTLSTPAVDAQASSATIRAACDVALLFGGVVLWLPVLHPVPGTGQLSTLSRAGYLVVQSIVPTFMCIVWIFARHSLYTPYDHPGTVFGLSSLADQQLSGFVAKLGTIFVLWSVAFAIVLRSEQVAEDGGDPEPLTWADVERQLERVERRERRGAGTLGPPRLDPPLRPGWPPPVTPPGAAPPGKLAPGWALGPDSGGRDARRSRRDEGGEPRRT